MAIAVGGNDPGLILAAVQIAHEPADRGNMGRYSMLLCKGFRDPFHADIHRNMRVQKCVGNIQIDVVRHMIGCMIGDTHYPANANIAQLNIAHMAVRQMIG